mmetsp:Transcript_15192/g.32662  ORF Transcript_15192/g.32662 Transcript_15192/m.32662 type:complete len:265 (+) Transcript_15192:288-1082(+)
MPPSSISFINKKCPKWLACIMVSKPSLVVDWVPIMSPALHTRASMNSGFCDFSLLNCRCCCMILDACRIEPKSVRSMGTKTSWSFRIKPTVLLLVSFRRTDGCSRMSCIALLARDAFRHSMATVAPCAASNRAVSLPIPLLAPVTTTSLPSNVFPPPRKEGSRFVLPLPLPSVSTSTSTPTTWMRRVFNARRMLPIAKSPATTRVVPARHDGISMPLSLSISLVLRQTPQACPTPTAADHETSTSTHRTEIDRSDEGWDHLISR